MSNKKCLHDERIKVIENDVERYGTAVDFLSKEDTKACAMFGHLIAAKMDDSGEIEEFTYGWEWVHE